MTESPESPKIQVRSRSTSIFPEMGQNFFSDDESAATDESVAENDEFIDGVDDYGDGEEANKDVPESPKPRRYTNYGSGRSGNTGGSRRSRYGRNTGTLDRMAAKDQSLLQTANEDIPADFEPDTVSGMFRSHDFSYLTLRPDHA